MTTILAECESAQGQWRNNIYKFRKDLSKIEKGTATFFRVQSQSESFAESSLRTLAGLLNGFSPFSRGLLMPTYFGHPPLSFIELKSNDDQIHEFSRLLDVLSCQGKIQGQKLYDLIILLRSRSTGLTAPITFEYTKRSIGFKWNKQKGLLTEEVVHGVTLQL